MSILTLELYRFMTQGTRPYGARELKAGDSASGRWCARTRPVGARELKETAKIIRIQSCLCNEGDERQTSKKEDGRFFY
jgi:hypothetical protein